LTDDLATVLEEIDANDAAIFGFSMGGGEVARYRLRHRGKNVSQVALILSKVPYMLQTKDKPEGTPQATFDQITESIKIQKHSYLK
jgi:non-heme chloroperoxidase